MSTTNAERAHGASSPVRHGLVPGGKAVGSALVAVATMVVGLVVLAAPAGAHHTEGQIDTVGCIEAGDEKPYRNAADEFVPIQTNLEYPLIADRDPDLQHSQQGSFMVESASAITSIQAKFRANGAWRSGSGGGADTTPKTITFSSDRCIPVSEPAASSTWECGEDVVGITLDNEKSTVSTTFNVNGTDHEVDPGVIDATSATVAAPVENGTRQVIVMVGDQVLSDVVHDGDCVAPTAGIAWECGAGVITVDLDNSESELDVEFLIALDIEGPGSRDGGAIDGSTAMEKVLVPAGETDEYTLAEPAEGTTATVTVFSGEEILADAVIGVDCEDPVASLEWECGSDVLVALDNTSSEVPVTFTVNGEDVDVPAGVETQVTVPGPVEDGDAVEVSVTVDGVEIASASYSADCEEVDAETECAASEEWIDTNGDGIVTEDECNEVQGEQITRTPTATPTAAPQALAFTGLGSIQLLWSAAAMVLLGLGLILGSRELQSA